MSEHEPTTPAPGPGKERDLRLSAMVATAAAFLVFLYLFSPFTQVLLGWFVDFEDNRSHRVHEVAFGALFAIIFIGVLVQLRPSTRNFAGLIQATVAAVVLAFAITASTGVEWYALTYLVPLGILIWLHPGRADVVRYRLQPYRPMVWLMAIVAIPLLDAWVSEFRKAGNEAAGHEAHWAGMAAFAMTLFIIGLFAALRVHGWPILAITSGTTVLLYSLLSLRFPFDASSRPGLTGILGVLWSLGFLFVARKAPPVAAVPRGQRAVGSSGRQAALTWGLAVPLVLVGAMGLGIARDVTRPPVPHAVVSTNSRYCISCHAIGDQGATVIDPRNHPYGPAGTCIDCHDTREPDPAATGASGAFESPWSMRRRAPSLFHLEERPAAFVPSFEARGGR